MQVLTPRFLVENGRVKHPGSVAVVTSRVHLARIQCFKSLALTDSAVIRSIPQLGGNCQLNATVRVTDSVIYNATLRSIQEASLFEGSAGCMCPLKEITALSLLIGMIGRQ